MLDELIDRYGDPPPSVSDLVNVSLVRVQAAAVGVYEVTQKKDTLVLNLETLGLAMIRGLLQAFNGRVTAGAGSKALSLGGIAAGRKAAGTAAKHPESHGCHFEQQGAKPMKKKLLALVCALALTVSLVGCVFSTPDTVGKIGDFEVTSGLYLLAQYDAYQQAAQLAGSEQDASKVKSFLKATITTNADTGETAVVSDYVAQKTLETLQTLAAVDARFTELGGELTEEQKSAADSYAQQLMDNYGDTYTANGIGLETLKLFQQLQYKHTLLLDLVYGKNGETPVEDGELTEHLDSTMYEIGFITVPLYNTSTFAFASDDQKAEMLSLAQKAADNYNASAPEDTSSQLTTFNSIASSALTGICAVLDAEVPSTSTLQTDLLSESDLTDAFTQEGAADTLRGLAYGQAAAIQYSGYALMLAVRLDPLGVSTLDALRSQILSDMKGEELDDALAAYGAQLDNSLSSSAMSKLPAAKIVNANSANS